VTADRPSLRPATRILADELNALLNSTLTHRRLVQLNAPQADDGTQRMQLTFREQGRVVLAPLQTRRYGLMGLYIGQILQSRSDDQSGPALITLKYTYALHNGTDSESEPIIRLEYDRRPRDPNAQWCRRHIQGPLTLPLGGQPVSMNDLHFPSGYVALEDVIRFCIYDLGVKALSDDWDDILIASYRKYRGQFRS
jgi:hypothetical protein